MTRAENPPALRTIESLFWLALDLGDMEAANEYRHAMLAARQEGGQ